MIFLSLFFSLLITSPDFILISKFTFQRNTPFNWSSIFEFLEWGLIDLIWKMITQEDMLITEIDKYFEKCVFIRAYDFVWVMDIFFIEIYQITKIFFAFGSWTCISRNQALKLDSIFVMFYKSRNNSEEHSPRMV